MSGHEVLPTPESGHLREQAIAEFAEIADQLPMVPFITTERYEEGNGYDAVAQTAPCIPVSHITHFREVPVYEFDQQPANPREVIKVVAENFEIPAHEITGSSRTEEVVLARHVAMHIIKNKTGFSYPRIRDLFNKRDHTSVMHGCKRVSSALEEEPDSLLATQHEVITRQLQESHGTYSEIGSDLQRDGESVVAMTRENLFQLPVCTLDARQSYMLGFDPSDPPFALDWERRSNNPRLWEQYGQTALTRTKQFRQALLAKDNSDHPGAQEHLA